MQGLMMMKKRKTMHVVCVQTNWLREIKFVCLLVRRDENVFEIIDDYGRIMYMISKKKEESCEKMLTLQ